MAGLGKIVVSTDDLDRAAKEVASKASDYEQNYNALYNLVNDLKSAWAGTDNNAYTDQINGFKNDFQKMKQLMDEYSEFLSNTAATYRQTQEEIAAKAKTLRTDA